MALLRACSVGVLHSKRFKYIIYMEKKLLLKVVKKAVPLFFIMADAVGPECRPELKYVDNGLLFKGICCFVMS
jgi:hypothetical protein